MKYFIKGFLPVLLVLFLSNVAFAVEKPDESETISIPKIEFALPGFSTSTKKLEPVRIEGVGYAVGAVHREDGKLFLGHSVGFILPKENKGGVLKIAFVSVPKDPAKLSFKLYPHETSHKTLELDLKKVEVQVPAGQVYVFLGVEGIDIMEVEEIKFNERAELSNEETCDCKQIKALLGDKIDVSEIKMLLGR